MVNFMSWLLVYWPLLLLFLLVLLITIMISFVSLVEIAFAVGKQSRLSHGFSLHVCLVCYFFFLFFVFPCLFCLFFIFLHFCFVCSANHVTKSFFFLFFFPLSFEKVVNSAKYEMKTIVMMLFGHFVNYLFL